MVSVRSRRSWKQRGEGGIASAIVQDVLVDFVREDHHIGVSPQHRCQGGQLVSLQNSACRVRGRIQEPANVSSDRARPQADQASV
jgi:hypothetical protein